MKKEFKNSMKGFTLIELMVAIAIVAILATIGYTLLQNSQAVGRDSKRRQDIDAAAQALETNWNPTTSEYQQLTPGMFTTNALPADPINSGTYVYSWNGITAAPVSPATGYSTFLLCAYLEKGGGNSGSSSSITSGTTYYCKKNQQQ